MFLGGKRMIVLVVSDKLGLLPVWFGPCLPVVDPSFGFIVVWENSVLISCTFFLSSSMSSSIFLNCFGEVCSAPQTAFRSLSYPLESTYLLQSRAMFFPSLVIPLIAVSLRLVQFFVRCILQLHTMQQNVSSFFLIFC